MHRVLVHVPEGQDWSAIVRECDGWLESLGSEMERSAFFKPGKRNYDILPYSHVIHFLFSDANDAMLFKLIWGGK